MQKENDNAPHSIALWLRWETHERKPNSQLSGSPKDVKDYRGVLHCENREEARDMIESVINRLTEDLKQCQLKLQSKTQENTSLPE